MPKCYLPIDVFYCIANDRIVFLDLKRNAYITVEVPSSRHFLNLSDASTDPPPTPSGLPPEGWPAITSLLTSMINRGLLTTDPSYGREAKSVSITAPSKTLLPRAALHSVPHSFTAWTKPTHLVAFWKATALAAGMLKVMPMWRIVRYAKKRRTNGMQVGQLFSETFSAELISDYYRLRPFLLVGRESCLFDSLALLHFLASFSLFPQWIFGVQMRPFVAHCWLQHENAVLNDTIERVRDYVPIMSV